MTPHHLVEVPQDLRLLGIEMRPVVSGFERIRVVVVGDVDPATRITVGQPRAPHLRLLVDDGERHAGLLELDAGQQTGLAAVRLAVPGAGCPGIPHRNRRAPEVELANIVSPGWGRWIQLASRPVGALKSLVPIGVLGSAVLVTGVGSGPGGTPGSYTLISTTTASAPPATPLTPNDGGYVRVQTKSGAVSCSINAELVACRTAANNWPTDSDGQHQHVASVKANGEFNWVKADLGLLEGKVTMDYQTYSAVGWTIVARSDGTKFTNDRTGHGMSVSVQSVTPF